MTKERKLYGFKVDAGLLYKVPVTFVGPYGLTAKQQKTFLNKIIKDWVIPVIRKAKQNV